MAKNVTTKPTVAPRKNKGTKGVTKPAGKQTPQYKVKKAQEKRAARLAAGERVVTPYTAEEKSRIHAFAQERYEAFAAHGHLAEDGIHLKRSYLPKLLVEDWRYPASGKTFLSDKCGSKARGLFEELIKNNHTIYSVATAIRKRTKVIINEKLAAQNKVCADLLAQATAPRKYADDSDDSDDE